MMENKYRELSPEDFIRRLFKDTVNGKMSITYYPFFGEIYECTYPMTWQETDLEEVLLEYATLSNTLTHLAELHNQLESEEDRNRLLTQEEREAWKVYVKKFEPFKVAESEMDELWLRSEFDQMTEEENQLLEDHCQWNENQSLQRLPFKRRSPFMLIDAGARFAEAKGQNAPQVVMKELGRRLAEELVLYNFFDMDAKSDSALDRLLGGEEH